MRSIASLSVVFFETNLIEPQYSILLKRNVEHSFTRVRIGVQTIVCSVIAVIANTFIF